MNLILKITSTNPRVPLSQLLHLPLGEQPTRLWILRGESPLPSIARFGRLAYPTWRKVTTSTVLGRKSHGCHTTVVVSVGATGVASKSGGLKRSE
jgi:hypothetical protein